MFWGFLLVGFAYDTVQWVRCLFYINIDKCLNLIQTQLVTLYKWDMQCTYHVHNMLKHVYSNLMHNNCRCFLPQRHQNSPGDRVRPSFSEGEDVATITIPWCLQAYWKIMHYKNCPKEKMEQTHDSTGRQLGKMGVRDGAWPKSCVSTGQCSMFATLSKYERCRCQPRPRCVAFFDCSKSQEQIPRIRLFAFRGWAIKRPKTFQSNGSGVRLSSPLSPNGLWNGYSMI